MTKFVIRRVLQAIPVLFGITVVVYGILLAAPGGPTAKFANNPRMTEEQKDKFKQGLGPRPADPDPVLPLDGLLQPRDRGHGARLPADARRLHRADGLPELPAGRPERRHQRRAPRRLRLLDQLRREGRATGSSAPPCRRSSSPASRWSSGSSIAIVLGVLLGHPPLLRVRQRATVFAYVGFAMPTFWLGIMLIFIFSGPGLNILPAGGMTETRPVAAVRPRRVLGVLRRRTRVQALGDIGKHLILPVITLVVVNIAGDSRFVRASMLESLGQDYVRTAKAKGLPPRVVNFKHALRQRAAAGHHEHRPRDPVPVHGRDRHRDDLLVARDRQAHHRRDARRSTTRS